jgi:hypothetical protein
MILHQSPGTDEPARRWLAVPRAPLPLLEISAFTRVFDALCGERSDRASDPGEGPMHDSSSWRLPLTRRPQRVEDARKRADGRRPLPASGERWRSRPASCDSIRSERIVMKWDSSRAGTDMATESRTASIGLPSHGRGK